MLTENGNGYVSETKQPAVINRAVMRPLPKAAEIGIAEAEVTDPRTGEIKTRLVLSPQAQRIPLERLDSLPDEP